MIPKFLTSLPSLGAGLLAVLLATSTTFAQGRAPTLPAGSENLRVPAGNIVSMHTYAQGFQTWRWDAPTGTWLFTGPVAVLYADPSMNGVIGYHGSGPIWVSNSGSSVTGQVQERSTVDAGSIPWLLLRTVSTRGPGVFEPTTYIQRVNTYGGLAPARAGQPNEVVWVPYRAEYFFYRAL